MRYENRTTEIAGLTIGRLNFLSWSFSTCQKMIRGRLQILATPAVTTDVGAAILYNLMFWALLLVDAGRTNVHRLTTDLHVRRDATYIAPPARRARMPATRKIRSRVVPGTTNPMPSNTMPTAMAIAGFRRDTSSMLATAAIKPIRNREAQIRAGP